MPIVVQASTGLLPKGSEKQMFADLMESFLRINGAAGNSFITPNLIGHVEIIEEGMSFAGGKQDNFVAVGLKVPSFALTEMAQKETFVKEATEIVLRATGDRLPPDRVFVNMVYGDGFWGIGGKVYSDYSLQATIDVANAPMSKTTK